MANYRNPTHTGPVPPHIRGAKNQARSQNANPIVRTSELHANSAGIYEIRWSEPVNGKWRSRTFSTRTKDKQAAEVFFDNWLSQVAQAGPAITVAIPSIDDLCEDYLRVRPVQKYLLKPVRKVFGPLPYTVLGNDTLQLYRARRPGIKDSSIRRELAVLVAALNHAVRGKVIAPHDLPKIELPPVSQPRLLYLNDKQLDKVWSAALVWPHWQVRLFILIALETGARRGAIEDLSWDRVDLAAGQIDFRNPGRPISKKRRAVLPISNRLLPILHEAAAKADKDAHGEPIGLVIGERKAREGFPKFARSVGLPWFTPHVCRHTWATQKIRKGASVALVAKGLADDVRTVMTTYVHLFADDLRDLVNL